MAAPVLTPQQQQASLRANMPKPGKSGKPEKAKKVVIKHVLMNPYSNTTWPTLENGVEACLIEKLATSFEKFALPKEKAGLKRKNLVNEEVQQTKKKLRSQVVFGVNCVTKALEKDCLQLVITCKSANPPILTQHLIGLSKTRKCVSVCINNLSKTLSDIINIGSVAIGFLKTDDACEAELNFKEFIDYVRSVVPKAWTENKKDENVIKKDVSSKERKKISESKGDNRIESISKGDNRINIGSGSETDSSKQELEGDTNITETSLSSSLNKIKPACQITEKPAVMNSSFEDYSRFYVYKKDVKANTPSFGDDFIAFMSDSDVQSNSEEDEVKKKTKKIKNIESDEYTTIDVRRMKQNEKKKKSKKKIKKALKKQNK
ncbi:RPP38 [Mytilus coruscus]|uniref:RPP38 n=1 Tax=Mytilus coruscus TaxID=42192 RepID=A0A6J8C6G2_MYTCO|nr:RPP38 [Mytilus coruscus]